MTPTFGFAGSSAYGADCQQRLVAAGIDFAFVLTQPDRPAGRSRRPTSTPVGDAARALGLLVVAPERAIGVLATIEQTDVAAMAICAYGQLLPAPLLEARPWLNLHPSLLPRWRGAAPIERAILAGDAETAVAVMQVVLELDAGPIVSLDRFPIDDLDAGAVMRRSLELGVPRLAAALRASAAGSLRSSPQRAEGLTYAHKLVAGDRVLDPGGPVADALRHVRALSPHVGAAITLGGERFVVWRARPSTAVARFGEVLAGGAIHCGFADGAVELVELQPSGKRSMGAAELLRGWRRPLQPATRAG